jgi:hypothetical protein
MICVGCFCSAPLQAESRLTLTLDVQAEPGPTTVPPDFVGLSFGMKALLPNSRGEHFFSPTNTPLVIIFKNLGIRHLRMGGTTVESPPATPIPGRQEIDDLFAFAAAAGVNKIIYSLRLLETDSAQHYAVTNAAIAKYIWDHYREQLDCFSIGNEPDRRVIFDKDLTITNFQTYLEKWRKFAGAITSTVPEAKFAGPDGSSGNVSWTTAFADAEAGSSIVKVITEHFYVGARGRGVEPVAGIEAILSPRWITANENLYRKIATPVFSKGFQLRFTEANDHYSGGVPGASDTFAGALWALDFLHWWAAHGAVGVDFHNTQWVVNDIITPDANGQLTINPKGYGLKAFESGGYGLPEPLTIDNPEKINLTAYAMRREKQRFLTLINKEHGPGARKATATIIAKGTLKQAESMRLATATGDVATKSGITLGGASINNKSLWQGVWSSLKPQKDGKCTLEVPAASAVIVRLRF